MTSSKIKNNIYAMISILTLIFVIGSFVLSINFLIKINKVSSEVNITIIKDNTTVFDSQRYEKIKDRLD
jgi:hypothetical protein